MVGKFVEFYGDGLARLPLADRATISNMAPEQGATCVIFPIDAETLALPALHRPAGGAGRAGRGLRARAGPVPRRADAEEAIYTDTLELDLATSSRASPARAARRTACRCTTPRSPSSASSSAITGRAAPREPPSPTATPLARFAGRGRPHRGRRAGAVARYGGRGRDRAARRCHARPRLGRDRGDHELHEHLEPGRDGRRRACSRGRPSSAASSAKPWVKTSLAPGLEGRDRLPRARRA